LSCISLDLTKIHQQNLNWSGHSTLTSKTLWYPLPVILRTSRCFQTPLKLWIVLSDTARALSGLTECCCSYGGIFRMLRNITIGIVNLWKRWDVCIGLQETLRAAETSVQVVLKEIDRNWDLSAFSAGDLVPYSHGSCFWSSRTTRHFIYHIRLYYSNKIHYNII
jgi:hypothetical protein